MPLKIGEIVERRFAPWPPVKPIRRPASVSVALDRGRRRRMFHQTAGLRRLLLSPFLHPRKHLPFGLKPLVRVVLRHPSRRMSVIVSLTCSGSPASSRSVTPVCRRSWKRKPGARK